MSNLTTADTLSRGPETSVPFLLRRHRGVPALAVLLIGLFVTGAALSKSSLIGRLANPMTHNDVAYLIDGIHRLLYAEVNGFWGELVHLYYEPLHAPFTAYQATLAFLIFGFHDWAPYFSNVIYVWILLFVAAWLMRGRPTVVVIAALLAVAGIPLTTSTVTEFAPEVPLGLFSAIGVLLTIRIRTLEPAWRQRIAAGMVFGLAFLAKPSSLAFVPVVVSATLGMMFLRDVIIARKFSRWAIGLAYCALQFLLSLWLAAIYVIPNFSIFADYFYTALFDKANVTAYGFFSGLMPNILYCLVGPGGEYTFARFLWVYLVIIAAGTGLAVWRRDYQFVTNMFQLYLMTLFMYLLPTFSLAKNFLFGAPFAFLLIFMLVLSIRLIYDYFRNSVGVMVSVGLGCFLLVSGHPTELLPNVPAFEWNAPGRHAVRNVWISTQNRFYTDLIGNSPNYNNRSVYLTEGSGYYHAAPLSYWFLKKDIFLDWTWYSNWAEENPAKHLEYIKELKPDFVIAGAKGNGLTFKLSNIAGAAAAEDAVLDALWADPDYMAIDQFYGPNGPPIVVFERRAAFAGWQPLGGLLPRGTSNHPSWASWQPWAHISAYVPEAAPGVLTLGVWGKPGQTIRTEFNGTLLKTITLDATGYGSLDSELDLKQGQNDVVFQFSGEDPVLFDRLLISRDLHRLQ